MACHQTGDKPSTQLIGWLMDLVQVSTHWYKIDGLVQVRRNSIAYALELRLSCTNPPK